MTIIVFGLFTTPVGKDLMFAVGLRPFEKQRAKRKKQKARKAPAELAACEVSKVAVCFLPFAIILSIPDLSQPNLFLPQAFVLQTLLAVSRHPCFLANWAPCLCVKRLPRR